MKLLKKELYFKTTRSGGKGGQNVNKVETKVELYFNIKESFVLSDTQKEKLLKKLASRLSEEGVLKITEDNSRSQLTNKENALKRLFALLNKMLQSERPRKATKPTKASRIKRSEGKKRRSDIKQSRRKLF
ncbi:MAG: aminoacyl-tRNA hydrolase [Bacteroidetes bacterium]|nr:aminoacyl-tRNA hydrolase [Bacteroidota bacterium]